MTNLNASVLQDEKQSKFSDFVLGKEESDRSQINKPYGVAYYKNQVFVVDTRHNGYMILTPDDEIVKFVSGTGPGRMVKPINISIDEEGNRFITDTSLNQVLMFDKDDDFVQAFGTKDQFKPADVLVVGDNLYITDLANHIIHVLSKRSGATRMEISVKGAKEGQLFFPTNLALTPEKNIMVTDTGNFRLQVFNEKGKFIRSYGEAGSGFGQFARPKGVAVDKEGRIYAVDAAFENVQIFNKKGQLLLVFGKPGNGRDNINLPADIFISYDGVDAFQKYVDERFTVEYLIFVTSQFGPNKVNVYGFGTYRR